MSNCEQRFVFVTLHKTLKIKRLFLHQRCVQLKGTFLMSLITFKKNKMTFWNTMSFGKVYYFKEVFQNIIQNEFLIFKVPNSGMISGSHLQVWRDISTPFSQVAPARWVLGRNSLTCNRSCDISWKDTFPLKTNIFFLPWQGTIV